MEDLIGFLLSPYSTPVFIVWGFGWFAGYLILVTESQLADYEARVELTPGSAFKRDVDHIIHAIWSWPYLVAKVLARMLNELYQVYLVKQSIKIERQLRECRSLARSVPEQMWDGYIEELKELSMKQERLKQRIAQSLFFN